MKYVSGVEDHMRIVDLSGRVESGLWGYHELPGLEKIVPRAAVETIATVSENGFFASRVVLSTISGTYVEAGSHILENGRNLEDYSVDDFIRPAKVIKLPGVKPKTLVDADLLEKHAPVIEKGEALVIGTEWGKRWNKPGYVLECPNYSRDGLEWILSRDISILGVDVPCIEASWSEDDDESKGGLLGEMFSRGILLVAPLINVEKIRGSSGTLVCLPLNLKYTSGAPGRVVFMEEE